jgi:AraC-like DNA-binding protein
MYEKRFMPSQGTDAGGAGLERSCDPGPSDWLRTSRWSAGVELLDARLETSAYSRHRHDTYGIGLTMEGVQAFDYRGETRRSLPGQVVVLHPDEVHDGRPDTHDGLRYQLIYVEPRLIFDAVETLHRGPRRLPFAQEPVLDSPQIAAALRQAFAGDRSPLAIDDLVLTIAQGLMERDRSFSRARAEGTLDRPALERARAFLEAEKLRVVTSAELEDATGLNRYELARQFRRMFGASPYRYLLMRRLDEGKAQLEMGKRIVDIALDTGFADQAHFTRAFSAAFGVPPARYRALNGFPPGGDRPR